MSTLEEAIQQTKFDNEQIKANLNILYTAHWLQNKINQTLKPFHVTHEQYNILRILKGSHPKKMCQKDILSRMIAPNSNVTLLTKKLLSKKLIQIQASSIDKREYQISITQLGQKLLKEINNNFQANQLNLNQLSVSEAFHLNALLEKLRIE